MTSFRRWINSGWHVIALPAWYLLIVFIIIMALQGCGTECSYFTRCVERFDRCVESPDCTFTFAEFYDYNTALMRRDANCPKP